MNVSARWAESDSGLRFLLAGGAGAPGAPGADVGYDPSTGSPLVSTWTIDRPNRSM